MRLSHILQSKGSEVVTTRPDVTILQAIRSLVDRNIGALVVRERSRTVGILTERDLLRFLARGPADLESVLVRELMTRNVVTAEAGDTLAHAMEVMTEHRVRHLPILESGELAGIVSIGDVVNTLRNETESENHQLREYISTAG
jgi:CBS domain-containing protein